METDAGQMHKVLPDREDREKKERKVEMGMYGSVPCHGVSVRRTIQQV
jgi:hypothetical protein